MIDVELQVATDADMATATATVDTTTDAPTTDDTTIDGLIAAPNDETAEASTGEMEETTTDAMVPTKTEATRISIAAMVKARNAAILATTIVAKTAPIEMEIANIMNETREEAIAATILGMIDAMATGITSATADTATITTTTTTVATQEMTRQMDNSATHKTRDNIKIPTNQQRN